MCEDRGINHSDCRAGRKVIFGTTPSSVSSLLPPETCLELWPKCVFCVFFFLLDFYLFRFLLEIKHVIKH